MEGKVFKIGQEVQMTEDRIVNGFSNEKLQIRKGDKAYVDGNRFLHYTSGEAKGKIMMSYLNVEGYDFENISKLIFERLNHYNLDEFIEENEIDKKEFIEEIEMALLDIL